MRPEKNKGTRRTNNSDQHLVEVWKIKTLEHAPQSFNRSFGLKFIYRSYVVIVIDQILGEMALKIHRYRND